MSKRFVKKQQMQWTPRGARLVLQIRTNIVICSLFVQRFTWRRILHLLRSATRHFCSLFVQQMRSCPSAESVHQTQVFSVLLAFPSLVNGWTNRFGLRGDRRV